MGDGVADQPGDPAAMPGSCNPRHKPPGLQLCAAEQILRGMSTVQEIESAINKLPLEKKEAIRDWLDETIEGQLEVSDEFKAKIQRARREIATGLYSRVREPGTGR